MTQNPLRAFGPLSLTALAVAAVLIGALLTTPSAALPDRACTQLVTGTYLTTIVDGQGNMLSRSALTLHADGTLQSVDSNQGGIPGQFNPFTQDTGQWVCTAHDSITASSIDFTLPGSEGPQQSLARYDFNARINFRTKALEGTIELIFFPLTADPFHDTGSSAGVFSFSAIPLVLPGR